MKLHTILVLILAAALASCGVKSNLDLPNGKSNPKHQQDPSRPPSPIGQ